LTFAWPSALGPRPWFQHFATFTVFTIFTAVLVPPAAAEPSLTGQTGLIYMPDARIDPDGTWRTGYSLNDPYSAIWISLTAMPRLEASLRYTETDGVPGFSDADRAESYGNFKDKSFDAKFLLIEEGRLMPAVAIGGQDIFGTRVYPANYLTLGKKVGDFDLTVGYGTDRIDGAFGGVRYRPEWMKGWGLVAEYDATDFSGDIGSSITGVDQRKKEVVAGVEYRKGWLGLQAGYGHDELSVNAYVAIPLQQKDFVPDINEPAPYTRITPRPRLEQWNDDTVHRQRMLQALLKQDFKNVRIASACCRRC